MEDPGAAGEQRRAGERRFSVAREVIRSCPRFSPVAGPEFSILSSSSVCLSGEC